MLEAKNESDPENNQPVTGYVVVNTDGCFMDEQGVWAKEKPGEAGAKPYVHTPAHLADIVARSSRRWGQFIQNNVDNSPETAYSATFNPQTGEVSIDKVHLIDFSRLRDIVRPELPPLADVKSKPPSPQS